MRIVIRNESGDLANFRFYKTRRNTIEIQLQAQRTTSIQLRNGAQAFIDVNEKEAVLFDLAIAPKAIVPKVPVDAN